MFEDLATSMLPLINVLFILTIINALDFGTSKCLHCILEHVGDQVKVLRRKVRKRVTPTRIFRSVILPIENTETSVNKSMKNIVKALK